MSIQEINRRMDKWWDEKFETGDVDIKRAADIGVDEMANDVEFCKEYTRYFLRNALYQRGIDLASRRRSMIREEGKAIAKAKIAQSYIYDRIVPPSPRTINQASDEREQDRIFDHEEVGPFIPSLVNPPAKLTRPWSEWMERDPDTGHHVEFRTLNKRKLLAKATEKEVGATRNVHEATFYRLVAGRLPDMETKNGDVLSEDDLNMILANIQGKMTVTVGLAGIPNHFTWEKLLS